MAPATRTHALLAVAAELLGPVLGDASRRRSGADGDVGAAAGADCGPHAPRRAPLGRGLRTRTSAGPEPVTRWTAARFCSPLRSVVAKPRPWPSTTPPWPWRRAASSTVGSSPLSDSPKGGVDHATEVGTLTPPAARRRGCRVARGPPAHSRRVLRWRRGGGPAAHAVPRGPASGRLRAERRRRSTRCRGRVRRNGGRGVRRDGQGRAALLGVHHACGRPHR